MGRPVQFSTSVLVTVVFGFILTSCGDQRRELSSTTPGGPDGAGMGTPTQAPGRLTESTKRTTSSESGQSPKTQPTQPAAPPPPPAIVIPPTERILIVSDGKEQIISESDARKLGLDIIDFRDTWTPNIFRTHTSPEGDQLEHSYRDIFVKLANDQGDNDGLPIEEGEFNYLEVFGIPPSFSVLWKRIDREDKDQCYREIDYDKIRAVGSIRFGSRSYQKKQMKKVKEAERSVEKAMTREVVDTYDDLLSIAPKYRKKVELLRSYQQQVEAIRNIELRLSCDLHNHPRYRHKEGRLDQGLRLGIRRFQRKHKLYEYANLKSDTIEALATPAHVSNFNSFRRALEERVIAAAEILEDGSVNRRKKQLTYVGEDGQTHEIRNLVEEFTDAAMRQLDLDHPDKVKAFFQRHSLEDFKWLRVGVRFPEKPEYYSSQMEFSITVDRGDIWYDPPFNAQGKKIKQRRRRLPKFKLYTEYRGQKIQLIHWPTTIGGWRKEIAPNGHLYYKYKNSDVGSRVIRNIISGPVWVPPKSTPLKSLAKRRYVNGRAQNIVNYEEMGPGYLSAYGLVAGYFVIPGRNGRPDHDKGIRAHGSSDFMSILSPERFSHGCHRLKNDHAVRLYSFILGHRNHLVHGDQRIRHERQFLHRDEVFQVRVLTRGYRYELQPPIPVEVLEGRIMGKVKKPIEDYVEDPEHDYPSGSPDDSPVPEELKEAAGGETAGEEAKEKSSAPQSGGAVPGVSPSSPSVAPDAPRPSP